jgi:hypothetical protein
MLFIVVSGFGIIFFVCDENGFYECNVLEVIFGTVPSALLLL